jgi:AcrR family transcriptional regulator
MAREEYAAQHPEPVGGGHPIAGEQQGPGPGAALTDTQQRILDAASRVFSREGYTGATTRAIAAEAGVNEVTLFRNFGSKKALLRAVVERFSALPALGALAGRLTGDYRQDLTTIATLFMEMLGRNRRHILMTIAEAQRDPDIRDIVARPPARQRQMLGQYLRRQMERGVVRDLPNPDLVAQAFFGMFLEYHLAQLLLPAAEADAVPPEEVVAQLVDLFVRGTGAPGKEAVAAQ